MANLNVIVLIGNLTNSPDLEYVQSGTARANFSIAVNEYRGDEQSTTFVPIVCWGNTAENTAEYLDKGSPVAILGRLEINNWEDDDGNNRKFPQVVAQRVQFLSTNPDNKKSNKKKSSKQDKKESQDAEDIPFDT